MKTLHITCCLMLGIQGPVSMAYPVSCQNALAPKSSIPAPPAALARIEKRQGKTLAVTQHAEDQIQAFEHYMAVYKEGISSMAIGLVEHLTEKTDVLMEVVEPDPVMTLHWRDKLIDEPLQMEIVRLVANSRDLSLHLDQDMIWLESEDLDEALLIPDKMWVELRSFLGKLLHVYLPRNAKQAKKWLAASAYEFHSDWDLIVIGGNGFFPCKAYVERVRDEARAKELEPVYMLQLFASHKHSLGPRFEDFSFTLRWQENKRVLKEAEVGPDTRALYNMQDLEGYTNQLRDIFRKVFSWKGSVSREEVLQTRNALAMLLGETQAILPPNCFRGLLRVAMGEGRYVTLLQGVYNEGVQSEITLPPAIDLILRPLFYSTDKKIVRGLTKGLPRSPRSMFRVPTQFRSHPKSGPDNRRILNGDVPANFWLGGPDAPMVKALGIAAELKVVPKENIRAKLLQLQETMRLSLNDVVLLYEHDDCDAPSHQPDRFYRVRLVAAPLGELLKRQNLYWFKQNFAYKDKGTGDTPFLYEQTIEFEPTILRLVLRPALYLSPVLRNKGFGKDLWEVQRCIAEAYFDRFDIATVAANYLTARSFADFYAADLSDWDLEKFVSADALHAAHQLGLLDGRQVSDLTGGGHDAERVAYRDEVLSLLKKEWAPKGNGNALKGIVSHLQKLSQTEDKDEINALLFRFYSLEVKGKIQRQPEMSAYMLKIMNQDALMNLEDLLRTEPAAIIHLAASQKTVSGKQQCSIAQAMELVKGGKVFYKLSNEEGKWLLVPELIAGGGHGEGSGLADRGVPIKDLFIPEMPNAARRGEQSVSDRVSAAPHAGEYTLLPDGGETFVELLGRHRAAGHLLNNMVRDAQEDWNDPRTWGIDPGESEDFVVQLSQMKIIELAREYRDNREMGEDSQALSQQSELLRGPDADLLSLQALLNSFSDPLSMQQAISGAWYDCYKWQKKLSDPALPQMERPKIQEKLRIAKQRKAIVRELVRRCVRPKDFDPQATFARIVMRQGKVLAITRRAEEKIKRLDRWVYEQPNPAEILSCGLLRKVTASMDILVDLVLPDMDKVLVFSLKYPMQDDPLNKKIAGDIKAALGRQEKLFFIIKKDQIHLEAENPENDILVDEMDLNAAITLLRDVATEPLPLDASELRALLRDHPIGIKTGWEVLASTHACTGTKSYDHKVMAEAQRQGLRPGYLLHYHPRTSYLNKIDALGELADREHFYRRAVMLSRGDFVGDETWGEVRISGNAQNGMRGWQNMTSAVYDMESVEAWSSRIKEIIQNILLLKDSAAPETVFPLVEQLRSILHRIRQDREMHEISEFLAFALGEREYELFSRVYDLRSVPNGLSSELSTPRDLILSQLFKPGDEAIRSLDAISVESLRAQCDSDFLDLYGNLALAYSMDPAIRKEIDEFLEGNGLSDVLHESDPAKIRLAAVKLKAFHRTLQSPWRILWQSGLNQEKTEESV